MEKKNKQGEKEEKYDDFYVDFLQYLLLGKESWHCNIKETFNQRRRELEKENHHNSLSNTASLDHLRGDNHHCND